MVTPPDKVRSQSSRSRPHAALAILVAVSVQLLLLFALGCSSPQFHFPAPPQKPVDMLYDDDCDGDIDCAITQPILNHWIDLGYVKVWGMVSSGHSRLGAPTLRIFRDYYGHSNLFSIGAWTPGCESNNSTPWTVAVVNKFDPGDTCDNYENCASVLRRSVAQYAASGGSAQGLDYVITGPLTCEEAFRNSLPDAISPLTGVQMEQHYIKQFVAMNGLAPSGGEYNCGADARACNAFFANVTAQNGYPTIYVVPDNTGAPQVITQVPVSSLPQSNPTEVAFSSQGTTSEPDEDSMAVEYAVYGDTGWFISPNSTNTVNAANGTNTWISTVPSGQYYLTLLYGPGLFEFLLSNPWLPSN